MESVEAIADILAVWVPAVTAVVTAAAGVAALTPTRADNRVLDVVLRILNILALNVGRAKNADDVQEGDD